MQTLKYKKWNLLFAEGILPEEAKALFDAIGANKYDIQAVLKEHHRSNVFRITLDDKDLVLKIPKEKNSRLWIRLMTLFREGEAFKNLNSMTLLADAGILTTKPILAAEYRKNGMVVDSWLLYEYLDGMSCLDRPETYLKVIDTLKKIHDQGLLHGDSQIRNFIEHNQDIYVIDSNPTKPGFSGFDFGFEWAYLKRSCPDIEEHYGEILNSFWYKLAAWYDTNERKFSRTKRKLRGKL